MASTQSSSESFVLPKWRRIHWRDISIETENEGCHAATSENCLPYFHHEGEVQEKLNYYYLQASNGKVQFDQKQVDKIQNARKPRHHHPNVYHHLHTSAYPCPQQCGCCYCKRCAIAGVEVHSDIKRKTYQSRHFMSPSLAKKACPMKEVLVRGRKRSRIPALESYDEDSPSRKEVRRVKPKMEIRHTRSRHLTRAYRKCPLVR